MSMALSNAELLQRELEKAKKGTDSEKLDVILEVLFKLLAVMTSMNPTLPSNTKPPQMIG